jgi:hypothetical protein
LSLASVLGPSLDGAAFTLFWRNSPEIFEDEAPVVSRTKRVPTEALESEGSDNKLECPGGSTGSEFCDSAD